MTAPREMSDGQLLEAWARSGEQDHALRLELERRGLIGSAGSQLGFDLEGAELREGGQLQIE